MATRKICRIASVSLGIFLIILGIFAANRWLRHPIQGFDGQRAYQDVLTEMAFGPRTVGSPAHAQVIAWMRAELEKAGWQVQIQQAEAMGHPIENVVARRGTRLPQIVLGAHYDSRLLADQDKGPGSAAPVPGANDGASGVAVLLELSRSLPFNSVPIELVFFDAEDNGNLPGWDWLLGSRAYVAALTFRPRAAIILDMIGDRDLNIYQEANSNKALVQEIWDQAAALGYQSQFIPQIKYSMEDDHTPFLEAGIPAVDIIDFDYPYWHTSQDTADKVSAVSLEVVGRTMWNWIVNQK